MKRSADINDIFRPLSSTLTQSALTNAIQIADILEWVLKQVGRSEVWQTSFSISEDCKEKGFFSSKFIFFGFKVGTKFKGTSLSETE